MAMRYAWRIALTIVCVLSQASSFSTNVHKSGLNRHGLVSHSSFVTRSGVMRHSHKRENRGKTSLNMFMGSDGGILGVGAPEVALTVIVGYFLLGPSDLYKLTKEIGKLFTSLRTLSTEATKSFESNMESQLELQELRKAQKELTDAFSFRRSINVNEEEEGAFERGPNAPTAEEEEEGGMPKKKVRRRRKVLKKPAAEETGPDLIPENPDLMRSPPSLNVPDVSMPPLEDMASLSPQPDDWFTPTPTPSMASSEEQSRFAAQLSGNWNERILANEDKLSPLSQIMERLSILEEEKRAAEMRLEEEFRLRTDLEERFYRDKRKVLEDAMVEVQADAYLSSQEEGKDKKDDAVPKKDETVQKKHETVQKKDETAKKGLNTTAHEEIQSLDVNATPPSSAYLDSLNGNATSSKSDALKNETDNKTKSLDVVSSD